VSYDGYSINPLNLALDLASLGEGTLSTEEFTRAQELMFTDHGYPADDEAVTRALKELGRRISAVLRRESGDDFLDSLATLLAEQDCRPYLTRHDGRPHLHYARDDAPPGEWIATMAVSGLVLYVCQNADNRDRLRRCAATGCGRWFADTSKNSSRRYCANACASRTTVAAHRARRRRCSPSGAGRGTDAMGR
jgi:predicted RNA-binding Zn ribbon-like protein